MRRCKRKRLQAINHEHVTFLKLLREQKREEKNDSRAKAKRTKKVKILKKNLLSFLEVKGFKSKTRIKGNTATINIPEVFSFTENPDTTIKILKKLMYYGMHIEINDIIINHSNCKVLGIGASTVMDVILLEIKKHRDRLKKPLDFCGARSESRVVNDVLEVSGLLRHLGFKFPEKAHIKKLELMKNSDTSQGVASTRVVDYFDDCLKTQNLMLAPEGKGKLSQILGEVIDNCEAHGGEFTEWYVLGHFHSYEGEAYGECHLVIFNFGMTIYESLKRTSTRETLNSLNNLTKKHQGYFKGNWTEETLWTLYALQEGVSRFRDQAKDPDRGNGTIILINNFQEIGKTNDGHFPKMSIISGGTYIYFNNKYMLSPKKIGNEERKIIAFNIQNDLNIPPDPYNVKLLKSYFPGTIISMKFYIDQAYIKGRMIKDGVGNENEN
jgi:hypothetical protein